MNERIVNAAPQLIPIWNLQDHPQNPRIALRQDVVDAIAAGLIDARWQPVEWHRKEGERPPATVWRVIRERIFHRDDFTCQYCGVRGARLECDHIVPVARGGGHEEANLATACLACNRSKSDKLISEWRPA